MSTFYSIFIVLCLLATGISFMNLADEFKNSILTLCFLHQACWLAMQGNWIHYLKSEMRSQQVSLQSVRMLSESSAIICFSLSEFSCFKNGNDAIKKDNVAAASKSLLEVHLKSFWVMPCSTPSF